MAKKKNAKKRITKKTKKAGKDLLGKVIDSLTGVGVQQAVKSIQTGVKDTVDYATKGVDRIVSYIIRTIAMFIIVMIGIVILFVGLASYISYAWKLNPGIGLIIVGGLLVLIGIITALSRK